MAFEYSDAYIISRPRARREWVEKTITHPATGDMAYTITSLASFCPNCSAPSETQGRYLGESGYYQRAVLYECRRCGTRYHKR